VHAEVDDDFTNKTTRQTSKQADSTYESTAYKNQFNWN